MNNRALLIGCGLLAALAIYFVRDRVTEIFYKDSKKTARIHADPKSGPVVNQNVVENVHRDLVTVMPGGTIHQAPQANTELQKLQLKLEQQRLFSQQSEQIPNLLESRKKLSNELDELEKERIAVEIQEGKDVVPNKLKSMEEKIDGLKAQIEIIDQKLKALNSPTSKRGNGTSPELFRSEYLQVSNETTNGGVVNPEDGSKPMERRLTKLISKVDHSVATIKVPPGGKIRVEASWNTDKEQQIVIVLPTGKEVKIMRIKDELTWDSPVNVTQDYTLYRIKAEEKTDTWHAGEVRGPVLEAEFHRAYIGWKYRSQFTETMARITPEGFPLQ